MYDGELSANAWFVPSAVSFIVCPAVYEPESVQLYNADVEPDTLIVQRVEPTLEAPEQSEVLVSLTVTTELLLKASFNFNRSLTSVIVMPVVVGNVNTPSQFSLLDVLMYWLFGYVHAVLGVELAVAA